MNGTTRITVRERGLTRQRRGPVREHRRPLPLHPEQRARVVDEDAAVHPHELSPPDQSGDLVR
jgi:hypothetical protein